MAACGVTHGDGAQGGPTPTLSLCSSPVNVGDYIQAVLDRNLAENISRVLYPNDNVSRDGGCPSFKDGWRLRSSPFHQDVAEMFLVVFQPSVVLGWGLRLSPAAAQLSPFLCKSELCTVREGSEDEHVLLQKYPLSANN